MCVGCNCPTSVLFCPPRADPALVAALLCIYTDLVEFNCEFNCFICMQLCLRMAWLGCPTASRCGIDLCL